MKIKEGIPYGIAILALVVGTFYDYQITDTLFHSVPYIGVFFERFALLPIIIVVSITMCMLYTQRRQVAYLLLAYGATYYVMWDFQHYWKNPNTITLYVILAIVSLLLVSLIQTVVSRLPHRWIEQHLRFFVFMTTVLLCALLITTIWKVFWGRIRYRDMQDISEFCVWYRPSGITGYNSFPSGHTTMASVILCILQWKTNRFEKPSVLRYVLVASFIILMAITRMIMGAHFISDTAMGFIVTYTCYLGVRSYFRKRGYL